MGIPKRDSYNLFIGIAIALLAVILVTLPGLAGTPGEPVATDSLTGTPTDLEAGTEITNTPLATPTPTASMTQEAQISPTSIISPTPTASPTDQSTATPVPTVLSMTLVDQFSYLPLISQLVIPPSPPPYNPERVLFCDSINQPIAIPDDNTDGLNNDISINDARQLVDIRVSVDISHTYVGDLVVKLSYLGTGQSTTVLNQPGKLPGDCANDNIVAIFDDKASQPGDAQCPPYTYITPAISGIYLPSQSLSVFSGQGISGTWRLNVADQAQYDTGFLKHWCLQATVADTLPPPTPPPTPTSLPSSATVNGMSGQDQQRALDCESRSAVDWASHFGVTIDEIDFLNHLSISDDPEAGFVGNVNGIWGQIPPNDYGVHANAVAALLRQYGLVARSYHSLRWDDLRAEIAAGNPAIVWIVGGPSYSLVNGKPYFYTAASTGYTSVVAPYEHTVILVGYTPTSVTVINGSRLVTLPLDQFLDSWSALDFMAVLARP